MKWYPWLNQTYRQIIECHRNGNAHHALLIHSIDAIGDDILVWGISRWLMCHNPKEFKSCNECYSCQLMQAHTHPDWYCLKPDKGRILLGINSVRSIIDKLYHFSQQGRAKIIWQPNASQITEAAANALLKTLEDPPMNCWFFLSSHEPWRLLATLRSRCITWRLLPPDEKDSLVWLQKQCIQSQEVMHTALKLSNGSPVAALKLLNHERWKIRQMLCKTIPEVIYSDILKLLPILNNNYVTECLYWLITLLIDTIKYHYGASKWIVNIDSQDIIKQLSQQINNNILHKSVQEWMKCYRDLQSVATLNRELILTNSLLRWEDLLAVK
ncbi:DNA polymerase III subunit delta' C-terminal domain-containing protein [Pantoea sp. Aalb]|uniref:DNA polymerase III subunit delta' C-terminal domain-containing protein n=1 Tax=Pantoea sp. Aalb TaxID=2576762 RepID=UPI00132CBFFD|nr:DNA polymerase III subunit delta' C-terminal domain-containing protein [Pantoea sp. Aalb]MXP67459.1 DNA polymerase III subunit delta' [Pantoea sp. Aalb]